jgi:hypothetical protein
MNAAQEEIQLGNANFLQNKMTQTHAMEFDPSIGIPSGSSTPCFSGSDSSSIPTTPEYDFFPKVEAIPAAVPSHSLSAAFSLREDPISGVTLAENVDNAIWISNHHIKTTPQEDGEFGIVQEIGFLKSEPMPHLTSWPSSISPSCQFLITPKYNMMKSQDSSGDIFISPIFPTVASQSSSLASTPRGSVPAFQF